MISCPSIHFVCGIQHNISKDYTGYISHQCCLSSINYTQCTQLPSNVTSLSIILHHYTFHLCSYIWLKWLNATFDINEFCTVWVMNHMIIYILIIYLFNIQLFRCCPLFPSLCISYIPLFLTNCYYLWIFYYTLLH